MKSRTEQRHRGISEGFKVENFIPGIVIGFIIGFFLDLKSPRNHVAKKNLLPRKLEENILNKDQNDQELKMVLVVRQDLKMGAGKIASQCAHAATGMYAELIRSERLLLGRWEQCGQPKIVVSCKNLQEMNGIKETADNIGLPTFVVSDAGKTQIAAGSKTVLAIGPGPKTLINSVTGKLRLL